MSKLPTPATATKADYIQAIEGLLKALDDQCFPVGVRPTEMRCDYSLSVEEAIVAAKRILPVKKQRAVAKRNLARLVKQ